MTIFPSGVSSIYKFIENHHAVYIAHIVIDDSVVIEPDILSIIKRFYPLTEFIA